MGIDPTLGKGLATGAKAGGKALLAKAMLQWKRRGASPLTDLAAGTVDRELEEALDTLTGDAATLPDAIAKRLKAAISARPPMFAEIEVREWLRIPEVRAVIKDATLASVAQEAIDAQRAEAERLYLAATGDADWYGGALFDHAVAFLSLTLDAKTSTETRLGIATGNRNTARLAADIADVGRTVADGNDRMLALLQQVVDGQASGPFPAEIVGEHILAEVAIETRWRAIVDDGQVERAVRLAERVAVGGDLQEAPPAARTGAMRMAAATLARNGCASDAAKWLDAATDAGANDLGTDRARVAIFEKDWNAAATLLKDRTDRMAVSLAIDLIRGRDGDAAALDHVDRHMEHADMTGFLVPAVATWMATANRWEDAENLYAAASDEQIEENPTLLYARARMRIAMLGPADQRLGTIESASNLPRPSAVRNDAEGARLLNAARDDLAGLAALIPADRYAAFAVSVDVHRLYLDLLSGDPGLIEAATDRLHDKLADYDQVVNYAWLALAFDIEFDETTLRANLDRARAVGGWHQGQLVTAFQLAMRDDREGGSLAAFIDANRNQLVEALGAGQTVGIEIEALARQGRIPEGRARLDEWRDRLEPDTIGRLEALLDEQEGGNPLAIRLARFEATDAEPDLLALIGALGDARDDRLADYSALMWRRRHRTEDAVRACNVYFNSGRDGPLDAFLEEIGTGVDDDPQLSAHAAWASYRAGELDEADRRLAPLRGASPDNVSLRQLDINVALEGGDWRRLAPLVREDLDRREHRSARQLLQAAELAHAMDDPISDELTRAAAAAAPDDAAVLMQAFTQALRRGRDWSDETGEWLRRAIELSGDSGPLQRRKLQDIIELRDEHFRRSLEIDDLIMSGDVPLAMVAAPLGTTLSELVLSRLAANVTIEDGRHRACLPFVAGNRLNVDMTGATRIGLDPNAILALQLCGLLEDTLGAFPEIVIPAGTLPSVFNDLTRADRSQPARVEQGIRIKELAGNGRLETLPAVPADVDPFDDLHAAAERLGGSVVHGFPIHVAGTFMEEVRDAEPFKERLVSPGAVAAALAALGETSIEETEKAAKRLEGSGSWPDEAPPDLDRPLVVDGVSLHALDDAGILEPLLRAGTKIFIPKAVVDMAENEIRQRSDSQELARSIETVRATLRSALTSGKAVIGKFRRDAEAMPRDKDGNVERDPALAPLISLLQDGSGVEALVSGDRMVNRHGVFTDRTGGGRPVLTIIDVINQLVRAGRITAARRATAIRKLREAGVAMIPTDADEVAAAAAIGNWTHGPSRDLRAICDSIHLPLLRRALLLPDDRHWLRGATLSMALAIRKCWADLDVEVATKAADFLFHNLPNVGGWIERDPDPSASAWADEVATAVHAVLALPFEVPPERLEAYHDWYASRVRPRLEGRDRAALAGVRSRLGLVLTTPRQQDDPDIGPVSPEQEARLNRLVAGLVPKFHLDALVDEAAVHAALGGTRAAIVVDEHEVEIAAVARFLGDAMDGVVSPLTAVDGTVLAESGDARPDGSATITRPWGTLRFDMAGLFAKDPAMRRLTFDALAAQNTIAPSSAALWRDVVASAPLPADLMVILMDELHASPETFLASLRQTDHPLNFSDISTLDERLLASILDVADPAADLAATIDAVATAHAAAPGLARAARVLAPLAVSPDLKFGKLVAGLGDDEVAGLCGELLEEGDAFSLVAAFEACCARHASPACVAVGNSILEALFGEEGRHEQIAHDWCIAARMVLASADLVHALPDWPLPQRRATLLAHAGNVSRALAGYDFDRPELLTYAYGWIATRYRLRGQLERVESSEWVRDWLNPSVVTAQMIRRMDAALHTIDVEERPKSWVVGIAKGVGPFAGSHSSAMFAIPGPLDAFSPTFRRGEDLESDKWAPEIVGAEAVPALNMLYVLVSVAGPPNDLPPMVDAVAELVGRCDSEHRNQAIQLSFVAAAKWKSADLADRLMEIVLAEPGARSKHIGATAEFAVSAAAAQPDALAMRDAAIARLTDLAFGPLNQDAAEILANFLDLLANVIPQWATELERLRIAALLAA